METRTEKDRIDVAFPRFQAVYCESCFEEKELFDVGRKISRLVSATVSYCICMDCLKEIRPVSEMTEDLRDDFNREQHRKAMNQVKTGTVKHI